jgi:hypothetical protein
MMRWLKMKIAVWLDRRRPDLCWASLCTWALGYRDRRDGFDIIICEVDCRRNGTCWCGKLVRPDVRERLEAEDS